MKFQMPFQLPLWMLLLALPAHAVIYGEDNRTEPSASQDPRVKEANQATATMIWRNRLKQRRDGDFELAKLDLKKRGDFCASEAHSDQGSHGTCGGVLISEDIILTAGHCMPEEFVCNEYVWMFGYEQGVEPWLESRRVPADQVYSCKGVIDQLDSGDIDFGFKVMGFSVDHYDYALIKLDRPVRNVRPASFADPSIPLEGRSIFTISSPFGMFKKLSDGARVMSPSDYATASEFNQALQVFNSMFVSNLDIGAGSSGSPIFDSESGKVVGLISSGPNKDTERVYEDHGEFWEKSKWCEKEIHLKDDFSELIGTVGFRASYLPIYESENWRTAPLKVMASVRYDDLTARYGEATPFLPRTAPGKEVYCLESNAKGLYTSNQLMITEKGPKWEDGITTGSRILPGSRKLRADEQGNVFFRADRKTIFYCPANPAERTDLYETSWPVDIR